ncbi:TPA: hypothetical protein QH746_000114 [Klebsiella variicola]|nr:hypothetical protein [Klebsiella variicola]
MTTSDAIAFAALVVSIYTIISSEVKSRKSDREQKVIKDEQDRLRKLGVFHFYINWFAQ